MHAGPGKLRTNLFLAGIGDIPSIAQGPLSHPTPLVDRVYPKLQIVYVVQGVEDPEDVHACYPSFFHKSVDYIVSIRGVPHSIDSSQQHLQKRKGKFMLFSDQNWRLLGASPEH